MLLNNLRRRDRHRQTHNVQSSHRLDKDHPAEPGATKTSPQPAVRGREAGSPTLDAPFDV